MSKKSNKSPVCESCGRDGVGCMSPNWKPPAVSLKAQLREVSAALSEEQAFRAAIQSGWDKDMEMWQGRIQKLVAEHTDLVTTLGRDLVYFKEQNKELAKRLDYETRRAAQALEVADNAAIGTACIARLVADYKAALEQSLRG